MNTREWPITGAQRDRTGYHHCVDGPAIATFVPFVTPAEIRTLAEYLDERAVPADLEFKLRVLAQGGVLEQIIEKQCRRFISLLLAEQAGLFNEASPHQKELLLALLAYVRRDDDEIPDDLPRGYVDDHLQIRAALPELGHLLEQFNLWRLRTQVPVIWRLAVAEARVTWDSQR
jgi:hypothetical protein